jgi:MoxR-like ATPase
LVVAKDIYQDKIFLDNPEISLEEKMANIVTRLKVDNAKKPYVIGADMRNYFAKILSFVMSTRVPCDLIGDPGTGKTHLGREVAMQYARANDVPAFYCQVDEEMMKASLIAGKAYENGSLVTYRAAVGEAMVTGGIVFVDELTHGMAGIQLVFNSIGDEESRTSIGDMMLEAHPKFRLMFGHNMTTSPGNSPLKTSFASRLMAWPFSYPEAKTEALIAKTLAAKHLGKDQVTIPDSAFAYITSWARDVRKETGNLIPISARNVGAIGMLLSLTERDTSADLLPKFSQAGTSAEPLRRKVASRIFFKQAQSSADLHHREVDELLKFISQIGEDQFIQAILQGSMYYLDLENVNRTTAQNWREYMKTTII